MNQDNCLQDMLSDLGEVIQGKEELSETDYFKLCKIMNLYKDSVPSDCWNRLDKFVDDFVIHNVYGFGNKTMSDVLEAYKNIELWVRQYKGGDSDE